MKLAKKVLDLHEEKIQSHAEFMKAWEQKLEDSWLGKKDISDGTKKTMLRMLIKRNERFKNKAFRHGFLSDFKKTGNLRDNPYFKSERDRRGRPKTSKSYDEFKDGLNARKRFEENK